MASEPFAPDRQVFGEDLCAAAGLVSDQMDMAKELLRHHFPGTGVEEVPLAVLKLQERIEHALNGPPIMLPVDPEELLGDDG